MKIKKGLFIPAIVVAIAMLMTGCVEQTGVTAPSFVGTWKSETVDIYTHYMIFGSDGSYTGRWTYEDTGALYSEVTGTWSVSGSILTTVTDHTDMYVFSFTNDNTVEINVDSEDRTYFRQ